MNVQMRTLDAIMGEMGYPRVDLMKIDVEGAEMSVLQGAVKTLRSNEDLVLLMDLHPQLGVDVLQLCTYLEQLDFTFYEMTPPYTTPFHPTDRTTEIIARRSLV